MKQIILSLAAFLFVNITFAQTENADAVYEKLIREYTLENDGSTSFREVKQLKLKTHLSFNRLYGETFIIYNPEFQKLTINEAYTIMADSTKIETPENAFNEVLPRNAALSATANHLREMVVTHTALEIGATIYLDYTLTSAKGFTPGLMGTVIIEESSPVLDMEVNVKVPPDVELNHRMTGLRTAPEIMVVGSQKVYTWKFTGLQASPKEQFRGKFQPATPRLSFTTAGTTADVVNWITRQQTFNFEMNDQMKSLVDSIKAKQTDEIKTLLAIQKEVTGNIVYERYDPSWLGYQVRQPVEVWKSNGGSKLEKSILLAALLGYANFNAVPVLIAPQQFFDVNSGNLSLFDDIAVMANTKGFGTIYLSAVTTDSQSLEYSLAQVVVIPLSKDAAASPVEPAKMDNEIIYTAKITFDAELKASGQVDLVLSGAANPFLALQEDKNSIKSMLTGDLIKNDSTIQVVNSNIAKSTLTFKAENNKPVTEQSGYYRWMLPNMTNGFDRWRITYLESTRKDPFVIPFPITEKYVYTIELPDGYVFVNKRTGDRFKSEAGSVSIDIKPKENQVEITREIRISETFIHPEEYNEFRAMINQWLDKNLRAVVFKAEK
ncbi:MAG: DUF3857 domain-containing protein [Bacteroidales bacterium]|nr:DUF3857 domain-containing protein [Bacteroidales bacterium]